MDSRWSVGPTALGSLGVLMALLLATPAGAVSVAHQITLTVDEVIASDGVVPQPEDFQPIPLVGAVYGGVFAVGPELLVMTGTNLPGALERFTLRIASIEWDMSRPDQIGPSSDDSFFAGFRGPGGLGAGSPGFDVAGGVITGLRGGVYGLGDIPFIDFFGDRFSAYDGDTRVNGSLAVAPLPAPPSVWVVVVGAASLVGLGRSRRGAMRRSPSPGENVTERCGYATPTR